MVDNLNQSIKIKQVESLDGILLYLNAGVFFLIGLKSVVSMQLLKECYSDTPVRLRNNFNYVTNGFWNETSQMQNRLRIDFKVDN